MLGMSIDPRRIHRMKEGVPGRGPVVYWMNREMRLHDNWALGHAITRANADGRGVVIVYNLLEDFLGGGKRQLAFKVPALKELEHDAQEKGIGFHVAFGMESHLDVVRIATEFDACAIVTDFSPLRLPRAWLCEVAKAASMPVEEVDAHNVVPCRVASPKQEFGAYTLRPKLKQLLPEFFVPFPPFRAPSHPFRGALPKTDWKRIDAALGRATGPDACEWIVPGEAAAHRALRDFAEGGLPGYAEGRNDPNRDAQSGLSPYFHYGMLAPQRAALEARDANAPMADRDAFLEELIVRRELSDNFCFYNERYDVPDGFPDWAKASHALHAKDVREYRYGRVEFEHAKTHDALWNAAQRQMVQTGKMHGYLRMYWAKKILEWTKDPAEAMEIAIFLNDRYELDGRDPNGYAGIAWSIGGVHDRAWFDRPVFGKIRYMNANGAKGKFDVDAYIAKWA